MPGLYEFAGNGVKKIICREHAGGGIRSFAVAESDQLAALESPAPAPANARIAAAPPAAWAAAENRQRLWWWLLAIGGCALLAELALANRTSR